MLDGVDRVKCLALIEASEGRVLRVYNDSRGIPTIGVGRNLRDVGLTNAEADILLMRDYNRAENYLAQYSWYSGLNAPRKAACIDMVFTLGPGKFEGFKDFIAAMARGYFEVAAAALVDSVWNQEATRRVARDAYMIGQGVWPK